MLARLLIDIVGEDGCITISKRRTDSDLELQRSSAVNELGFSLDDVLESALATGLFIQQDDCILIQSGVDVAEFARLISEMQFEQTLLIAREAIRSCGVTMRCHLILLNCENVGSSKSGCVMNNRADLVSNEKSLPAAAIAVSQDAKQERDNQFRAARNVTLPLAHGKKLRVR